MSEERELKFAGVELAVLRDKLEDLESERITPPTFEDNWIFDRRGGLEKKGCLLRLRIDGNGAQLTFKGPQRHEKTTKIRAEHQTRVEDAGGMRSVLESLGFKVVNRYQKIREEWRLGGVIIALDHTPLGDFAEFEGAGCDTVARRCNLDLETAELRSYLRLYEDYREEHPEAPPNMIFDE